MGSAFPWRFLMKFTAKLPCVCCGENGENRVCLHHIYTKKAYPEYKYKAWNLLPVCQKCHNECHAQGTPFMANKYWKVKTWLISNGWEFDEFSRKWRHYEDN